MAADPGTDPMTAWLRSQIGERRALAEAAGGKEWRTGCSGEHGPMSHYPGCEQVEGDDITVYAEGGHNADQAAHIAANDPQDTIARCEAELAILDECEKAVRIARTYKDGDGILALAEARTWLAATSLIASGYQHRPGFRQDWLP